jgi:shikimate 5-dehydrogenase
VKGRRMLILGAGGAARAIAYEAVRRGAVVIVTGRSPVPARKLARDFGIIYTPLSGLRAVKCDILVNATPVGMAPRSHETPFPRTMLAGKIVFDAVYNPPMTRLLREASAAGSTIVRGTDMYINQGAMQFALYAGVPANIPLMKKLLLHDEEDA